MTQNHLTTEGKEALRKTIRGLREKLIAQLKEEAEREYRLGVSLEKAKLPEAKARRRERLEAWADEQSRADWPEAGKPSKGKAAKGESKLAGGQADLAEKKPPSDKILKELRERYLEQAVKEAAHTLINRLVILRILEASELSRPAVLTGGWKSAGYREFQDYAGALCSDAEDDTKGYGALLQLIFDELAVELSGVFGKVGLTSLFPIPAATLREVVEALNEPALDSAWSDDTTLGWIYQFWNDPEREALDAKVKNRGKIEAHEVASKTQLFSERYMVDWLLQNTLGQTWLAMCKKNGWTPEFEKVREKLDARRAEWRKKREADEVAADELMPIESELEHQWKYWVPQPMPEDAPGAAPESLRGLKLLDPACGSGHFLVIAFDLLGALYRQEARARGESWSDAEIAAWIVQDNLHGIDIDARAIQIAAAAVWLKAKLFAPDVQIQRMNLVAPTFKLAGLGAEDPALLELQKRLKVEVGIPEELTASLVQALEGVDHLGTLLRVDKSIRVALSQYEKENFGITAPKAQTTMFGEAPKEKIQLSLEDAEANVMAQLAKFLDAHEGESDLGLRLEGEQLAAGVRFLQIAQEGTYDVVVGNPPYQGTSKMAETRYYEKNYPEAKIDLLAGFYIRGTELCRPGGACGFITTSNWMFLSEYRKFRESMTRHGLTLLADFGKSAFTTGGTLISTCSAIFASGRSNVQSVAIRPHSPEEVTRDAGQPYRTWAGLLGQRGRFEFDVAKLAGIEGTPLVYWWDEEFLEEYVKAPKLGEVAPAKFGANTGNNTRFLRVPWEVRLESWGIGKGARCAWAPYIKGAKGLCWFEPLRTLVRWDGASLELSNSVVHHYGEAGLHWKLSNSDVYFVQGVAFSMIGASVTSRYHRYPSVIGDKGSSTYSEEPAKALCSMNTINSREVLVSLNPTVSFQVGDILRLPFLDVHGADKIIEIIDGAFTQHESHREPSVEFKQPGPSPWRYAQDWAQRSVDRPKGEPLPPYEEELDAPDATTFVSFAIGVALGRFGQSGEGILDLTLHSSIAESGAGEPECNGTDSKALLSAGAATQTGAKNAKSWQNALKSSEIEEKVQFTTTLSKTEKGGGDLVHGGRDHSEAEGGLEVPNIEPSPLPVGQEILPGGILFVSAALNVEDSLQHPAAGRIEAAWAEQSSAIVDAKKKTSLNEWLRKDFFAYHKKLYENRPIYFPLSSSGKNFVAWVSIHRWQDNTLQSLLANHLHPTREKLQGEINDLNAARASSDKKAKDAAEKQYAKSQKLFEELEDFIKDVTQCAEKGAPPTDSKCTPREVDDRFKMDLDDGVMINSAALWPLLLPQWKDPKKWWKELCCAQGRKDYDWAHLSARYFPERVDAKCKEDPSLGVAHGCFWKYHPAKAFAWELRLQDEIGPEFTIDEGWSPGDGTVIGDDSGVGSAGASNKHRKNFLRDHPDEVTEIQAKEETRRERNRKKAEKDASKKTGADSGSFELRN